MLLTPGQLQIPASLPAVFGREAPLALEIGFGSGSFLEHVAREQPDWNILGAELSLAAVSRTFRRLRRAGLSRVRLYRGHGRFLVRDILPDRSVHRLYINFPDPWPKERHEHRRLLRGPFFELAAARLSDDGALLLTTDHDAYFHMARREARASGYFSVDVAPAPDAALRTKYARKWKKQNKAIYHARFKLTGRPTQSPAPLITQTDMHHALLEGELPAIDRFEKQVHQLDGHTVVFLEAFRSVGDERLLLRTLIDEPDLRQDVMIEVRPSSAGLLVGVVPFAGPLTTRGTSDAVRLAAEWLVEQGCVLLEEKY